jgi:hypothetical protein
MMRPGRRSSFVWARRLGVSTCTDSVKRAGKCFPARMKLFSPRTRLVAPRTELISPRTTFFTARPTLMRPRPNVNRAVQNERWRSQNEIVRAREAFCRVRRRDGRVAGSHCAVTMRLWYGQKRFVRGDVSAMRGVESIVHGVTSLALLLELLTLLQLFGHAGTQRKFHCAAIHPPPRKGRLNTAHRLRLESARGAAALLSLETHHDGEPVWRLPTAIARQAPRPGRPPRDHETCANQGSASPLSR